MFSISNNLGPEKILAFVLFNFLARQKLLPKLCREVLGQPDRSRLHSLAFGFRSLEIIGSEQEAFFPLL
jgi:hypothetical protein